MLRVRRFVKDRLILVLVAIVGLSQIVGHGQTTRPHRIAGFGSSVAFGTGDETGKEGYIGVLREMMAPKHWEVLNQSHGGDTTITAAPRWSPVGTPDPQTRYLTTVNPGYVVIGLALSNEGIFEAKTKDAKEGVIKQFTNGINGFVEKARSQNIEPVVMLSYPRSVYTLEEYPYVKRMNITLSQSNMPTVNVLGATDDGTGRWARGFGFDDKHPNAVGHREFALSIVPTVFEALEKGKPTPTRPADAKGFARITSGAAPLTFTPDSTMHAFAVSMFVRAQSDGTVAAVSGSTLNAKIEAKTAPGGRAPTQYEEATLTQGQPFSATIAIKNGKWTYLSAAGTGLASTVNADGAWHHIVLSHFMARGETLFFVDGALAGSVSERLEPRRFVVGGPGSPQGVSAKQADYRDLFIFRSALNTEEAAVLAKGQILQASLEVYAPLSDAQFKGDSSVMNRAQSLAMLKVGSGKIVHAEDKIDLHH